MTEDGFEEALTRAMTEPVIAADPAGSTLPYLVKGRTWGKGIASSGTHWTAVGTTPAASPGFLYLGTRPSDVLWDRIVEGR